MSRRSFDLVPDAEVIENSDQFEPMEFEFKDTDTGEKRVLVATYPGAGMLVAMAASFAGRKADNNPLVGAMEFLEAAFNAEDWGYLRGKLKASKISADDHLVPLIEDMMEEWGDFPTQPSSVSVTSLPSTPTRSTGTSQRAGSRRPASRSTGS